MRALQFFKSICEFLEGCGGEPPRGWEWLRTGWARGLWWAALAAAIILFCGQSSKFIYIDF